MIGEPADPFTTLLEILPEWYFFPVFQILRTVPNKLLGSSSDDCLFDWYMQSPFGWALVQHYLLINP
ncbi:hypothetical protein H5410_011727 [Solanum commersonii]|uniref:Cytochrome b/b6 C-terminal region profile domain-containing protein n=1 Tax=Solanum commersonii TaxID=4109 RepID=A0A9J6APF9_SOLCO|nr:hypothetical protein H5410_011727 [Solanum commersonii]